MFLFILIRSFRLPSLVTDAAPFFQRMPTCALSECETDC